MKKIIKITPLILSSRYDDITTFTELYYLSEPDSTAVSGEFLKFVKLFFGDNDNIIEFQKRRKFLRINAGSITRIKPLEKLKSLNLHLDFPSLYNLFVDYLMKGIPSNVFKNDDIQPRASHFKIRGFSKNERLKIEEELKSENIVLEIPFKDFNQNLYDRFLIYCYNLTTFANHSYKKIELSSKKAPLHQPLLDNVFFNDMNTIAIELPIWFPIGSDLYLTGHPDLIQYFDDILIIADYKPKQKLFHSLPQICVYGLLFKYILNIENVKCLSFNMDKVWIYNPHTLLNKLTKYIKAKLLPTPWVKYLPADMF